MMFRGLPAYCLALLLCAASALAEERLPEARDAQTGAVISEAQFRDRVRSADILLLGEVHDNPRHHAGQGAILRLRLQRNDKPATVVFEMLSRSQQAAIDIYSGDASGFADAMAWEDRGWPDSSIYQPVFEAAFAARSRLVAGDLDRDTIRSLYSQGPYILPQEVLRFYRLLEPLPDDIRQDMTELQFDAHCGLFPRERMAGMVTVQRARDAALAEAVSSAYRQTKGPVFLIAGTGHVRTDHGAGALLHLALPNADILAIGFVERGSWHGGPSPFDFVIPTDPADRPDPCDELRKSHGGSGSG